MPAAAVGRRLHLVPALLRSAKACLTSELTVTSADACVTCELPDEPISTYIACGLTGACIKHELTMVFTTILHVLHVHC